MKYKTILIDCPWSFRTWSDKGKNRSAEKYYDVMSFDSLRQLPIKEIADDDSIMFMWATYPMLDKAIELGKYWGFAYKTVAFTWVKVNKKRASGFAVLNDPRNWFMSLGYWTRCLVSDTEIIIQNKESGYVEFTTLGQLAYRDISKYFIHTHNGWKSILNFWPNGLTDAVKIKTRLGLVKCSPDHRWFYKHTASQKIGGDKNKRKYEHVVDIGTPEIIAHKKKSDTGYSTNLLFSTTPIESQKPIRQCNNFELTEDIGWMIGLFCAEGHFPGHRERNIRYSLNIHETDYADRICSIVKRFQLDGDRYFNSKTQAHKFEQPNKGGMTVYFSSSKLKQLFEKFIKGSGANGRRLNLEFLLQTPADFRRAFLTGMLNGDGTKEHGGWNGYRRLCLCNRGLIEDFHVICKSLGIMAVVDSPVQRVKGKGKGNWIYTLRFISPKNKSIKLNGGKVIPVRIDDISPASTEFMYDIQVEDEAFVASDLISHNSNPEICLLFTRGKPKRKARNVRNLIVAPVSKHSEKPNEIYEKIEALVDGPYIEIFARQQYPNWTALGNEIDGRDIKVSLQEIASQQE